MNAGGLRHTISIQEKTGQRDGVGGQVESWTDVLTDIRAEALAIRGREYATLRAAQADITIRFRIRYRAGINPAMRVVWEGNPYGIVEVIDVGGRRSELELMCNGSAADA